MGLDRKRSPARDLSIAPETSFSTAAASSSSAFSRHTFNGRTVSGGLQPITRTESPPASAYFSEFAGDDHELQPTTPDASAHFAYSTTLRRHHTDLPLGSAHGPTFNNLRTVVEEGPGGLWDRLVQMVKAPFTSGGGAGTYERISTKEEKRDTPSARFVYYSIEVSLLSFSECAGWLSVCAVH